MESENAPEERLLETIVKSRSLKRNKLNLGMFYCVSGITFMMFIIMLTLSGYAASSAGHINVLITDAGTTLGDVDEIIPKINKALEILQAICRKANFTDDCG